MATKFATIDAYLATLSAADRAALEILRNTIRTAAPDAEEGFRYGLPAFIWNGKAIAGFGASTNHLSYYPMSGRTVAALARELGRYETSIRAIRFSPDRRSPTQRTSKASGRHYRPSFAKGFDDIKTR